jgi:hypothetical protein
MRTRFAIGKVLAIRQIESLCEIGVWWLIVTAIVVVVARHEANYTEVRSDFSWSFEFHSPRAKGLLGI